MTTGADVVAVVVDEELLALLDVVAADVVETVEFELDAEVTDETIDSVTGSEVRRWT